MIREGRKFGLSLILATQDMEQFNQEQRARLFMTGHKLFFKPPTSGIDNLAKMLSSATPDTNKNEWAERLAKLEKGQCWSLGSVQMPDGSLREKAILVNITALDARQFGAA
jgi:DNA phosphorothioation-dependent restriction protein DptH